MVQLEENIAFLKRMKSLYELDSIPSDVLWKSRLDIMIENEQEGLVKQFLVSVSEGAKQWWAQKYQEEIEKLEK
jgi:hypothetical protein